jgi:predicted transcriptional regulator of viral defense system
MLELLNKPDFVIFTTRDFASAAELSLPAASKRLDRLAEKGFLVRVTKGVWANANHPHFHPLACVPYLLGKEQGYVSFLTALHLHGIVSQIPQTLQVATTGRGRTLKSTLGVFEFLRIKPELMLLGSEWVDSHQPYLMATKEKALLDLLYLSTRKNRRFRSLPELDLVESGFKRRTFERLLKELPYPIRIRSAITSRWQQLL